MNDTEVDIAIILNEIGTIFVLPLLSLISMMAHVLAAYVFAFKEFKSGVYRYFMAGSIVDTTSLILLITLPLTSSLTAEKFFGSYNIISYQKYIGVYTAKALCMISWMISLKIALDRCLFVIKSTSRHYKRGQFYLTIFLFLIIPFIFSIPFLIFMEVKKYDKIDTILNVEVFYLTLSDAAKANDMMKLVIVYQYLPYAVNIITMVTLNSILIINLRKQLRLKCNSIQVNFNAYTNSVVSSSTSSSEMEQFVVNCHQSSKKQINARNRLLAYQKVVIIRNIENRITKMVIIVSFSFLMQQIFLSLAITLFAIVNPRTKQFCLYMFLCHLMYLFCYNINLTVYYNFDKAFKARLKNHIWKH